MRLLDRWRGTDGDAGCRCDAAFDRSIGAGPGERTELVVEADGCPGGGDLAAAPGCRATVVDALAERDADAVRTRAGGRERSYAGDAAAALVAAGRFADRVAFHDERLADRAREDPRAAAREATGRAGPVATIAAETGLSEAVARTSGYDDLLRATVGPTVAKSRAERRPPDGATLLDRRRLSTGATVRLFETPDGRRYHLDPPTTDLDAAATATLAAAHRRLADGAVEGGDRAPRRAVARVADEGDPVETLAAVLRRHTRGFGLLEHLFADDAVTDAFVTAPAAANPIRATVGDDRVATNVRLTPEGAAALASQLRRASGRSFSRASPTLDAAVEPEAAGGEVRVAGVTEPTSDGFAFAFRRHGADALTLPALIGNGTLTARAAAVLSVAVERGAAGLIAGTRGAGKTTLLGALLWELPARTRTVAVEDTPELPVGALQRRGRDLQRLRTGTGEEATVTPTGALRTALRLGEGALVVGEVRGEEARTLYEAMRVGAGGDAVLGTIHGAGGESVRERVVSDLNVPESSFAATDFLVTCTVADARRVSRIEEVRRSEEGTAFEPLFARDGNGLAATGAVERGNSELIASLARPGESYADVLAALDRREALLSGLAATDRTHPDDIVAAYRSREDETVEEVVRRSRSDDAAPGSEDGSGRRGEPGGDA